MNKCLIRRLLQIEKSFVSLYTRSYIWFNNISLDFKSSYKLVIRIKTIKYYKKLFYYLFFI